MHTLLEAGFSNALMAGALALTAYGLGRFCRRPALTHALWLLVLVKLLTPPLVRVPIPWPEPDSRHGGSDLVAQVEPPAVLVPAPFLAPPDPNGPEADMPAAVLPEALPDPPAEEVFPIPATAGAAAEEIVLPQKASGSQETGGVGGSVPWVVPLIVVWALGTVLWLALAAMRLGRFHTLLAHARPAPLELQTEADRLAGLLGLTRTPGVWLMPGVLSPMLWAVGRSSRLLLPAELLDRLRDDQRQALLVHELAHLRRRDHWVRWLELVVLALYWWLPVAWWARRELQEAEEECCDAWVVWALPHAAKAYAVALVETLDFLAEARPALPVAASGLGNLSSLRRRLTMIMRGNTPRALTRAGLLAVLGMGILLLPLVPSLAQPPATGNDPEEQQVQDQKARDIAKRREAMEKMQVEVEQARAEVAAQRAALEQKLKALEMRLQNLNAEQKRLADEEWYRAQKVQGPAMKPGTGPMKGGLGARPDVEHRLAEMERKLDLILREVKSLRQQRGPGAWQGQPGFQPGGGRPGGPGGGGVPSGQGPAGFPGGRETAPPGFQPPPGSPTPGTAPPFSPYAPPGNAVPGKAPPTPQQ
jgi:beta-lactamase regulating signal transducer with metallopeptidase domain